MATAMFPVNSSQISYIGYDREYSTLYVTFKNNVTYKYLRVPEEVYNTFKSSSSVGSYFSKYIKDQYDNSKVT